MIRVHHVILSLLAATSCLSLGACSTTPEDPNAEPREQVEYRTGSILPKKPGQKTDVIEVSPGAIAGAARPTTALPAPGGKN